MGSLILVSVTILFSLGFGLANFFNPAEAQTLTVNNVKSPFSLYGRVKTDVITKEGLQRNGGEYTFNEYYSNGSSDIFVELVPFGIGSNGQISNSGRGLVFTDNSGEFSPTASAEDPNSNDATPVVPVADVARFDRQGVFYDMRSAFVIQDYLDRLPSDLSVAEEDSVPFVLVASDGFGNSGASSWFRVTEDGQGCSSEEVQEAVSIIRDEVNNEGGSPSEKFAKFLDRLNNNPSCKYEAQTNITIRDGFMSGFITDTGLASEANQEGSTVAPVYNSATSSDIVIRNSDNTIYDTLSNMVQFEDSGMFYVPRKQFLDSIRNPEPGDPDIDINSNSTPDQIKDFFRGKTVDLIVMLPSDEPGQTKFALDTFQSFASVNGNNSTVRFKSSGTITASTIPEEINKTTASGDNVSLTQILNGVVPSNIGYEITCPDNLPDAISKDLCNDEGKVDVNRRASFAITDGDFPDGSEYSFLVEYPKLQESNTRTTIKITVETSPIFVLNDSSSYLDEDESGEIQLSLVDSAGFEIKNSPSSNTRIYLESFYASGGSATNEVCYFHIDDSGAVTDRSRLNEILDRMRIGPVASSFSTEDPNFLPEVCVYEVGGRYFDKSADEFVEVGNTYQVAVYLDTNVRPDDGNIPPAGGGGPSSPPIDPDSGEPIDEGGGSDDGLGGTIDPVVITPGQRQSVGNFQGSLSVTNSESSFQAREALGKLSSAYNASSAISGEGTLPDAIRNYMVPVNWPYGRPAFEMKGANEACWLKLDQDTFEASLLMGNSIDEVNQRLISYTSGDQSFVEAGWEGITTPTNLGSHTVNNYYRRYAISTQEDLQTGRQKPLDVMYTFEVPDENGNIIALPFDEQGEPDLDCDGIPNKWDEGPANPAIVRVANFLVGEWPSQDALGRLTEIMSYSSIDVSNGVLVEQGGVGDMRIVMWNGGYQYAYPDVDSYDRYFITFAIKEGQEDLLGWGDLNPPAVTFGINSPMGIYFQNSIPERTARGASRVWRWATGTPVERAQASADMTASVAQTAAEVTGIDFEARSMGRQILDGYNSAESVPDSTNIVAFRTACLDTFGPEAKVEACAREASNLARVDEVFGVPGESCEGLGGKIQCMISGFARTAYGTTVWIIDSVIQKQVLGGMSNGLRSITYAGILYNPDQASAQGIGEDIYLQLKNTIYEMWQAVVQVSNIILGLLFLIISVATILDFKIFDKYTIKSNIGYFIWGVIFIQLSYIIVGVIYDGAFLFNQAIAFVLMGPNSQNVLNIANPIDILIATSINFNHLSDIVISSLVGGVSTIAIVPVFLVSLVVKFALIVAAFLIFLFLFGAIAIANILIVISPVLGLLFVIPATRGLFKNVGVLASVIFLIQLMLIVFLSLSFRISDMAFHRSSYIGDTNSASDLLSYEPGSATLNPTGNDTILPKRAIIESIKSGDDALIGSAFDVFPVMLFMALALVFLFVAPAAAGSQMGKVATAFKSMGMTPVASVAERVQGAGKGYGRRVAGTIASVAGEDLAAAGVSYGRRLPGVEKFVKGPESWKQKKDKYDKINIRDIPSRLGSAAGNVYRHGPGLVISGVMTGTNMARSVLNKGLLNRDLSALEDYKARLEVLKRSGDRDKNREARRLERVIPRVERVARFRQSKAADLQSAVSRGQRDLLVGSGVAQVGKWLDPEGRSAGMIAADQKEREKRRSERVARYFPGTKAGRNARVRFADGDYQERDAQIKSNIERGELWNKAELMQASGGTTSQIALNDKRLGGILSTVRKMIEANKSQEDIDKFLNTMKKSIISSQHIVLDAIGKSDGSQEGMMEALTEKFDIEPEKLFNPLPKLKITYRGEKGTVRSIAAGMYPKRSRADTMEKILSSGASAPKKVVRLFENIASISDPTRRQEAAEQATAEMIRAINSPGGGSLPNIVGQGIFGGRVMERYDDTGIQNEHGNVDPDKLKTMRELGTRGAELLNTYKTNIDVDATDASGRARLAEDIGRLIQQYKDFYSTLDGKIQSSRKNRSIKDSTIGELESLYGILKMDQKQWDADPDSQRVARLETATRLAQAVKDIDQFNIQNKIYQEAERKSVSPDQISEEEVRGIITSAPIAMPTGIEVPLSIRNS